MSPVSESIIKDSVKKNSESLQNCEAYKLQQKSDLGADLYMESVVLNSPLRKSFLWLRDDKDGLHVEFRTVYHNIKNAPLYNHYPDFLILRRLNGVPALQQTKQANRYAIADVEIGFGYYIGRYLIDELKSDLAKTNYYSVLVEGSTDKAIVE